MSGSEEADSERDRVRRGSGTRAEVRVELTQDLSTEASRLGLDLRSLIRGVIGQVDSKLRLPSARVSISFGRGQPATGLSGGTPGFLSRITQYPEQELSLVLLVNANHIDPDPILEQMASLLAAG